MSRNPIARDLRTPKYRSRVIPSKKPKPDDWRDEIPDATAKPATPMLPAQCRMARAALQLGARELALKAIVGPSAVVRFEHGEQLEPRIVAAIQAVLIAAGISFLPDEGDGPGVRMEDRTQLPGRSGSRSTAPSIPFALRLATSSESSGGIIESASARLPDIARGYQVETQTIFQNKRRLCHPRRASLEDLRANP
jgi:hypothetical protein